MKNPLRRQADDYIFFISESMNVLSPVGASLVTVSIIFWQSAPLLRQKLVECSAKYLELLGGNNGGLT